MRPVFVFAFEGATDQQRTRAGAINKEIAGNFLATGQNDGFDEPVRFPQHRFNDAALGTHHAACLGVAAQEFGVDPRQSETRC